MKRNDASHFISFGSRLERSEHGFRDQKKYVSLKPIHTYWPSFLPYLINNNQYSARIISH